VFVAIFDEILLRNTFYHAVRLFMPGFCGADDALATRQRRAAVTAHGGRAAAASSGRNRHAGYIARIPLRCPPLPDAPRLCEACCHLVRTHAVASRAELLRSSRVKGSSAAHRSRTAVGRQPRLSLPFPGAAAAGRRAHSSCVYARCRCKSLVVALIASEGQRGASIAHGGPSLPLPAAAHARRGLHSSCVYACCRCKSLVVALFAREGQRGASIAHGSPSLPLPAAADARRGTHSSIVCARYRCKSLVVAFFAREGQRSASIAHGGPSLPFPGAPYARRGVHSSCVHARCRCKGMVDA
jgi:hypothetical protein